MINSFLTKTIKLSLLSCLLLTPSFPAYSSVRETEKTKHNILLITIDTLRPDHMGIYGYSRNTTPFMSTFFKKDLIFKKAFSGAPCTIPSIQQIIRGSFSRKDDSIAQILSQKKYQTTGIVHLSHFLNRNSMHKALSGGFNSFYVLKKKERDKNLSALGIKKLAETKKPFLMWLHYLSPHDPYTPPNKFKHAFLGKQDLIVNGDRRRAVRERGKGKEAQGWEFPQLRKEDAKSWHFKGSVFSEEERTQYVALYDAEIKHVDSQVQRVIEALRKQGLLDKTIIVITADHGEELGEHGIWDHCLSLHNREVHVPLIIRLPKDMPSPSVDTAIPVSTLDIVPSLLDLLGINHAPFDGTSVFRRNGQPILSLWKNYKMTLDKDWKIISNNEKDISIYEYNVDKDEERNKLTMRGSLTRLFDLLNSFDPKKRKIDEQMQQDLDELQSLGYLGESRN